MTILHFSLRHDIPTLARIAYQELTAAGRPDWARDAASLEKQAPPPRDACEYVARVLALSDELAVEWAEVVG